MSKQEFFTFFLVSESQDKSQVIFQAEIFLIELGPTLQVPQMPEGVHDPARLEEPRDVARGEDESGGGPVRH